MRGGLVWAMLTILLAGPALAEQAPALDSQIERVALFKNGLGFFERQAEVPAGAERVLLSPFAAPCHGTLWVTWSEGLELEAMVAREVTVAKERQAASLGELLKANVGRQVTVWLLGEQREPVSGKILSVVLERELAQTDPYAMGGVRGTPARGYYGPEYGRPPSVPAALVLLQRDTGPVVGIELGQVKGVELPGEGVVTTFADTSKGAELEADLRQPAKQGWLRVSYLANGATWAPSYLIDISDPNEARLVANAVIVNDAEPLQGAHVDLVTGFPNLLFAQVWSPMGLKEDMAQFLWSLTSERTEESRRRRLGVVTQQGVAYGGYGGAYPGAGPAGPPGPAPMAPAWATEVGTTVEDLFLYPLEKVTLGKGERGYYPIFDTRVPYEEFYRWDIPDFIGAQADRYGRPPDRPEQEQEEVLAVWHSLRLTNATRLPWTTAPAETVKQGQIIGQDVLGYTAPGAKVTVKITQAASVKAEQEEAETQRERGVVEYYDWHYDRVTVEGVLRVHNYQEKGISLEVAKHLRGEVLEANPQAEVVRTVRGLRAANPDSTITWKASLEAGAEQEFTYKYQVLVRQ